MFCRLKKWWYKPISYRNRIHTLLFSSVISGLVFCVFLYMASIGLFITDTSQLLAIYAMLCCLILAVMAGFGIICLWLENRVLPCLKERIEKEK